MSYDHKGFIQSESRKILKNSGRIQISQTTWVAREYAIENYGLIDWKTEEDRIEKEYRENLMNYQARSLIGRILARKPKREVNNWPYRKVSLTGIGKSNARTQSK